MNYVKMLGLFAIAAAALMASAGSASATLTDEEGALEPGDVIHATSEEHISITGSITITCHHSTLEGQVTNNDDTTADGKVTALTFINCTNHTVTVVKKGIFTIHDIGNNTGTITSTGMEITVLLHSFLLGTVHCIYTTDQTDIGEFTGSLHGTNTTATLDIGPRPILRTPTDGACGEHSTLEGKYEITRPDPLTIH